MFAPPDFLARLKDATRAHHDRVETSVGLMDWTRTDAAYARLLARFLGFFAPCEERLAPWLAPNPDLMYDHRRKAGWIAADLRTLGLSDDAVAALPRCNDLPAVDDAEAAYGVMYVLEGSTLGGQYIAYQVRVSLCRGPETGVSFFNSYGDAVRPMWKAFGAVLAAHAVDEARQRRVIDAACATFDAFERWFKPPG